MKRILVTGGTGYIGSHTCISLLEKGYDVTIVDNLVNSKALVVDRIENLSGKKVKFFEADVCDEDALRKIFAEDEIFAVIHFAGLKAVGESVQIPLRYYENNLISTLSLLKVMAEFKVNNFVFSSSATVYGNPASVPIREDFPLSTTNPYGTKALGEPPACSGAPAIRNAILNATGIGIDVAPITPHVLFAAFEKAGLFEKEETAHV